MVILSLLENVLYCKLTIDGELRWGLPNFNQGAGRWTDFISSIFDIPRLDALATLAKMLNTSIANISFPTKIWKPTDNTTAGRFIVDIPKHLYLPHLSCGPRCATLVGGDFIFDHAENITGAIVEYELDGQVFCISATTFNDRLCIGLCPPLACMLNQHLIDKYPGSTLLLFQDMRSALAMKNLLSKVGTNDPRKNIVTAHLGNDLSILPWNYFFGHDVVIIPAPSKADMSSVKLYRDYCIEAEATRFRVYPGFLLHSSLYSDFEDLNGVLSGDEYTLLRDCVVPDEEKILLNLDDIIVDKSISYEEYLAWGQNLGIFEKTKVLASANVLSETTALPPADPSLTPPSPQKLEEVRLHHIFRPGTIVMVLGAKNAGKTQFALSMCHALRKRGNLGSIFPYEANVPCRVAYIDAETPLDEFQANLCQYQLDNDDGFFGLSKFDKDTQNLFPDFSLMNQEFRRNVRNYLQKKKCRYLVLDNLTALMGDEVYYGGSAQVVIEWVEQLQKDGICTILIHHMTNADRDWHNGKARGSQIFSIRARTIIELIGKDKILCCSHVSETIKTSAHREGLTAGIRFNTCKSAPVLEGKTFYAHLPLGEAHWEGLTVTGADGKTIDFPGAKNGLPPTENAHGAPTDSTFPNKLKDLSPDQHRVAVLLKAGPAKRADIQNQLNCGEDKARACLNSLVDVGLVLKDGRGKGTFYKLNPVE